MIVRPDIAISTPQVFSRFDMSQVTEQDRPDTGQLIGALAKDIKEASRHMKNVLELVTMRWHDTVSLAKKVAWRRRVEASLMVGADRQCLDCSLIRRKHLEAYTMLSAYPQWECWIAKTV